MNHSVKRALVRGHLLITMPVFAITVLCVIAGEVTAGLVGFVVGVMVGSLTAWLWWSLMVPRWRDWVEDRGLMSSELEEKAVRTGLVWRRGSYFERTEFPRRNGQRGW